ncbi:unnamed protein product [uncultured bacterium]|nr:unnamed protein product [uncultured bacterium]
MSKPGPRELVRTRFLEEEGGGGEDDERHGDLGDDENAAHAQFAFALHAGGEGVLQGLPGGHESAGEGGEDGHEGGVGGDAPIGLDVEADGDGEGEGNRGGGFGGYEGDHEPEGGSRHGEQQAFGKELLEEASAGGAEGKADGDFLAADGGAGEEQAGDVDAGDQQDETDDHEEDDEKEADGERLFFLLEAGDAGDGRDGEVFVGFVFGWVFAIETLADGGEGGVELAVGHAGLHAPVGGEHGAIDVAGHEDIGRVAVADDAPVVIGEDAKDGVETAVEVDCLADDGGVGGEAGAPEVGMEDDDIAAIGFIPAAALGDGDAEGAEEIRGGLDGEDAAGFKAVVEIDEGLLVLADDIFEDAGAAQLVDHLGLDVAVTALADVNERRGVADGGLAEKELDGEGEHRGVETDAEAEGEEGGEDEARAFAQGADGVDEVAPEILKGVEAPEVEGLFLEECGVAEGNRVAVGGGHFAMEGEFGVEILLEGATAQEFEEEAADGFHWGCLASTRSTAAERRCQASCCSAMSLRPRLVIS